MHTHFIAGQVLRSRVLLGKVCRRRFLVACVQKPGIAVKSAEAGYRWASVLKQGIAKQVYRIRVLLGKCAEAGYCWATVQNRGIAGKV